MKLKEDQKQAMLTIADGTDDDELREAISDEVEEQEDIERIRLSASNALETRAAQRNGIEYEVQRVYDKATDELYK